MGLITPFSAISADGWSRFTREEPLPLGYTSDTARWGPNYTLHLIGGGMTYTALREWFEAHHYPLAPLLSAGALEQANAALDIAERNVERAAVRSPIAGQVVKRMVSVGEQVDGTAAQPIAEIANLDRVELAANLPAEYLSRVTLNMKAVITTAAYPGRPFDGAVIAIAPAVDATTNAGLARIRIANANRQLKVGIFAEATVKVRVPASDELLHTAAEGNGPVNALDKALRKALLPHYSVLAGFQLADYKVRILDGGNGTNAVTRVLIDMHNGTRRWTTVGASPNIIEASWRALADAVEYGLTMAS